MWHCSRLHENRDQAKFCGKCGEQRETRARCSACGSLQDPEDLFCTSCGHPRATEPPAAVTPIEVPPMPEPAPEPPPAAPAEEPAQDEPVTFSFGGAKIAMKEEALKPAKSAAKIERAPDKRDAISSTQYAILSFVLIAAVLGAAFYFITR